MTTKNLTWDGSKVDNDKDAIHSALGITDDRARQLVKGIEQQMNSTETFSGFIQKIIENGIVVDSHELIYSVYKAVAVARKSAIDHLLSSAAKTLAKGIADKVQEEMPAAVPATGSKEVN